MSNFYLFSSNQLTGFVLLLTAAAMLQTFCLSCGTRELKPREGKRAENLLESAVLAQILVLLLLMAQVCYHAGCGVVYPSGYGALRWAVFGALVGFSALVSQKKHIVSPVLIPPVAALTLPQAEQLAGKAFPVLYLAAAGFWFLRGVFFFFRRLRERKGKLTALSIKEAIDFLDTGLLFCEQNGLILLQNSRMQNLMAALTGALSYDGRAFYDRILAGEVRPDCRKVPMGEEMAYRLPDGRIWVFTLHRLESGKKAYSLLLASDTTESWTAAHELREQGRELERRNRELEQVLANLEDICRTEAAIYAKSRVHDVLGQRISLLLRALREHRAPDETLLSAFAEGLPRELYSVTGDGGYSLEPLAEAFRGLDVAVKIDGWLPAQEDAARALYEIAMEAVTNAVRHGYATEVQITIREENGTCRMEVHNSGLLPDGPVVEGGGLRGMRVRARRLGGRFSYDTEHGFHIVVELPEGEEACQT